MNDGIPAYAFLPLLKRHPELRKLRNTLTDNYDAFYKHLGLFRDEMPQIMSALASVDVLSGIDELEYAQLNSK